jgi:hypothetical protein
MIESTLTYPSTERDLYRKGILYGRWRRKYGQCSIFAELRKWEKTTRQIPVKCPPMKSQTYGFGELFAAIHYINIGYEVMWEYWGKNWDAPSYLKAIEILGEKAADLICRSQPQPPDLFVVDSENRFFFVEVKLPSDRLNKKQIVFNRRIERYLNQSMPQSRRAPRLPKGSWIEVLRLNPEPVLTENDTPSAVR